MLSFCSVILISRPRSSSTYSSVAAQTGAVTLFCNKGYDHDKFWTKLTCFIWKNAKLSNYILVQVLIHNEQQWNKCNVRLKVLYFECRCSIYCKCISYSGTKELLGHSIMSLSDWNEMPVQDVSHWLQYYSKPEILCSFSPVIYGACVLYLLQTLYVFPGFMWK